MPFVTNKPLIWGNFSDWLNSEKYSSDNSSFAPFMGQYLVFWYLSTSDQLASLVRFHRKRAGLSQVDMASMADVSRKVVQDLEAGRDGVSWRNLMAVLAVLNVNLRPDGPLIDEWFSRSETELEESARERESR
jgi:DNA-binding XRE family transcriptional regulator